MKTDLFQNHFNLPKKTEKFGFFSVFLLLYFSLLVYGGLHVKDSFAVQNDTSAPFTENKSIPLPVQKAAQSVIKICINKCDSDGNSYGTGFVIDNNLAVTNFHVVDSLRFQDVLRIETLSGKEIRFKKISHLSTLHDLAVLEV